MSDVVVRLLLAFTNLLLFAILGQVILSWLMVAGIRNELVLRLYHALTAVTAPIMRPLRRIIPTIGMIDIAPMVAVFVLIIIQRIIAEAL